MDVVGKDRQQRKQTYQALNKDRVIVGYISAKRGTLGWRSKSYLYRCCTAPNTAFS